jgi:hypothetical protein
MKSILNVVNRLEKSWELLRRLVVACNEFDVNHNSSPAYDRFRAELSKASAFVAKYEESK